MNIQHLVILLACCNTFSLVTMSVASLLRPTQSLRWCKGTKLLQWIQIIHCSLSPLQNHCQVKVQVYDIESHQFQSLSSCWAPCHLSARKWRQMAKALMNGSSTLIQCIQRSGCIKDAPCMPSHSGYCWSIDSLYASVDAGWDEAQGL